MKYSPKNKIKWSGVEIQKYKLTPGKKKSAKDLNHNENMETLWAKEGGCLSRKDQRSYLLKSEHWDTQYNLFWVRKMGERKQEV